MKINVAKPIDAESHRQDTYSDTPHPGESKSGNLEQQPSWFTVVSEETPDDEPRETVISRVVPQLTAAPLHAGSEDELLAFHERMQARLQATSRRAAHARLAETPKAGAELPKRSPRASWQDVSVDDVTESPIKSSKKRRKGQRLADEADHGTIRWRMLAVALMAGVAAGGGSLGGYLMSHPEAATVLVAQTQAKLAALPRLLTTATDDAKKGVTVIAKKPVQTARIDVADASGAVNAPISLPITTSPDDSGQPIALRITGLPPDAYITAGQQVAVGEWMLKPAELEKARLVVPRASAPEIGLEVTPLEASSGVPTAPSQDMRVALAGASQSLSSSAVNAPLNATADAPLGDMRIEPVSALPDQGFNKTSMPDAATPASAEAAALIGKAENLLKSGDVVGARQYFFKAKPLDVGEASYGVARTYDPVVFAELKVLGLQPDPAKAAEWYGKAAERGHAEAAAALARLKSQPQP